MEIEIAWREEACSKQKDCMMQWWFNMGEASGLMNDWADREHLLRV